MKFVTDAEILYGKQIMVYNVHCNLAVNVKHLGCSNDSSTFPFENKLEQLNKLVQKSSQPMQQILMRGDEQQSFQRATSTSIVKCLTKFKHYDGPLVAAKSGARQFKQLLTNQ